MFMGKEAILAAVSLERDRQERLKSEGKFPWTCDALGPSPEAKLAVLNEEVGEVANHVVERLIDPRRFDRAKLQEELIQVAAVAVAWAESLG